MYNHERKNKFILDTYSSPGFSYTVFNKTAVYEERDRVDLCEMSVERVQLILNDNFGTQQNYMNSVKSVVRSYCRWCEDHGISINHELTQNIQTDVASKMKKSMVTSPYHLKTVLDIAFDRPNKQTTDCLYRCYYWMAFAGLRAIDAMNVRIHDVDFDRMCIVYQDKYYEIYRDSVMDFKNACFLDDFMYEHPKYSSPISRKRKTSDFLMRGIRSEQIAFETLRAEANRAIKKSNVNISYTKIKLSGVFYRAYDIERIYGVVDFREDAIASLQNQSEEYLSSKEGVTALRVAERNMTKDYTAWKQAFG